METKNCIKCSKKILMNERFCRYCGADNSAEAIRARAEAEEKRLLEEKKRQEEEARRQAEEKKRLEEERRQAEEKRRLEEERKRFEEERRLEEERKHNEKKTFIISDTKEKMLLHGYNLASNVIYSDSSIVFVVSNEEGYYLVKSEVDGTNFMINKIVVPIDSGLHHIFLEHIYAIGKKEAFCLRIRGKELYIDSYGAPILDSDWGMAYTFCTAAISNNRIVVKASDLFFKKNIEICFGNINIKNAYVVACCGIEDHDYGFGCFVLRCTVDSDYFFMKLDLIRKRLKCFVPGRLGNNKPTTVIEDGNANLSWTVQVQEHCGQISCSCGSAVLSYWNDRGELLYHNLSKSDELPVYADNSLRNKPIIIASATIDLYGNGKGYCLRYKRKNGVEKYNLYTGKNMKMYCTDGRAVYGIENRYVYLFFVFGSLSNKVIKFE